MKRLTIALLVIILILAGGLFWKIKEPPKVVTKTEIEYVERTDTIVETIIKEEPVVVYLDRIKTVRGKDSIVFIEKPSDTTAIPVNKYEATIHADSSRAELEIFTTGKLYDVRGQIFTTQKNTFVETIKYRDRGGLFLYGEASVMPILNRAEVGLDWVIKNRFIIGGGISVDDIPGFYDRPNVNFNVKIGFRIF